MATTEAVIGQQSTVTDRQRQVLDLRERGLTPREIGIRLGISTQAVYRLIQRAEKASA